jgi:hypothetical protein
MYAQLQIADVIWLSVDRLAGTWAFNGQHALAEFVRLPAHLRK